ncbi:MAG: antitoxin MazE-like protein [Novosphingobium sp.]
MGMHENLTGAQRAARYRAAKRAQGLRLKQFWMPDLRNPRVREEIRRSAAEITRRDRADGTMDYLESLYDEAMVAMPPAKTERKPGQKR